MSITKIALGVCVGIIVAVVILGLVGAYGPRVMCAASGGQWFQRDGIGHCF